MAEATNGDHNMDVEMKEEGVETISPVETVSPFQPEQAQEQAATPSAPEPQPNGHPPAQADNTTAPQEGASLAQSQPGAEATIPQQQAQQPQPPAPVTMPIPAATSASTRETSTRPSSIPPPSIAPPERPNAHGSPTRVYLNQMVTPHLLEGMKYLAAYEPEKPLRWLSEFLAKRSAELEE